MHSAICPSASPLHRYYHQDQKYDNPSPLSLLGFPVQTTSSRVTLLVQPVACDGDDSIRALLDLIGRLGDTR